MADIKQIKKYARIELAKREFFYYCNTRAPKFYKKSRQFLVDMCNEMQDFLKSNDDVLIVNEPPR